MPCGREMCVRAGDDDASISIAGVMAESQNALRECPHLPCALLTPPFTAEPTGKASEQPDYEQPKTSPTTPAPTPSLCAQGMQASTSSPGRHTAPDKPPLRSNSNAHQVGGRAAAPSCDDLPKSEARTQHRHSQCHCHCHCCQRCQCFRRWWCCCRVRRHHHHRYRYRYRYRCR